MANNQAVYERLIARVREAALLGSCGAVLGWDERTNLPKKAAEFRGEQMSLLARLGHEMATSAAIGEDLVALEAAKFPGDAAAPEAANLREIRRHFDRATKLPASLVAELARVTTRAQGAWDTARKENHFATFQPWLEEVIKLKREESQAVGYVEHPYDALLDEFEPGATAAEIAKVFSGLTAELVPLIEAIRNSPRRPNRALLERDFPVDDQKSFGEMAARKIGFDFDAGRLDVTTHPFCSGIGPGDCRITTRYNPRFFNEAFFGILHEAGHGIYEQGLDPAHFGTPLGSAASLGIHESQSRFWENQIGRGRPFWNHFFPLAQAQFPAALEGVLQSDWLFALNEVRPSFIRVEADEATYNLHIVLRFEIEKELLTGNLRPADLPGAWNERFLKMLGLRPANDRDGCLQDIHWSMGGIGYFPTYTLGNLFAAQFMEAARRDMPELDTEVAHGEFGRLKDWLGRNIHIHGGRYRAAELCQRICGTGPDSKPLMNYLRGKYGEYYRV